MGDNGAFGLSGNYTVMQTTLALPQSMFPANTAIDGNTTVQPVLVWLDTCNLVPESITSIAMTGKPCVDKYGCVASEDKPPLYTISPGLPGELVPQWRVKSYRMRSIWVLGNYDNGRLPQPSTTGGANLPCNGINFVVTSKPSDFVGGKTFTACGPYNGTTGDMVSGGTVRIIMGGQPL
jgi:hypothetical protein